MAWNEILNFVRGPLFQAALIFFIFGLTFRIAQVVFLGMAAKHQPPRVGKTGGVIRSFGKGLVIFPFLPTMKGTFSGTAVMYVAGGLFHLGLFAAVLFGTPHMLVWKSLLGFGWPTLPPVVVDWLSAVAIVAMIVLLVYRLNHPVLKLLSGVQEWINWGLVFLPMITGYLLTHHLLLQYEAMFSIHFLAVDLLLIWMPFSRILHFVFYFFARVIHGVMFSRRAAMDAG